jgi:hypothetical protein
MIYLEDMPQAISGVLSDMRSRLSTQVDVESILDENTIILQLLILVLKET